VFTGIVEEVGRVKNLKRKGRGIFLSIEGRKVLEGTKKGDSIAVNGVCLTIVETGKNTFTTQVTEETLKRTNLGILSPQEKVNLERSLRPQDRLGGHFLLGHIDGMGRIERIKKMTEAWEMEISLPPSLLKYLVNKGSVGVEGVSLTVTEVKEESFGVVLIDFTLKNTTLGEKKVGGLLNVEIDIISKYVERFLSLQKKEVSFELLQERGFI